MLIYRDDYLFTLISQEAVHPLHIHEVALYGLLLVIMNMNTYPYQFYGFIKFTIITHPYYKAKFALC